MSSYNWVVRWCRKNMRANKNTYVMIALKITNKFFFHLMRSAVAISIWKKKE